MVEAVRNSLFLLAESGGICDRICVDLNTMQRSLALGTCRIWRMFWLVGPTVPRKDNKIHVLHLTRSPTATEALHLLLGE